MSLYISESNINKLKDLSNTMEMKEKYGVFSDENANYPAARIRTAYDVLNEELQLIEFMI